MSDLESIKSKIQTIRQGGYSEEDIKCICEIVFMRQLEWDEYPNQDSIEDIIDAVEKQREELRNEFNAELLESLKAKYKAGDVNAMVLLGQYFYNCPKDQQIEDLLVIEYIDKEVLGGAGCEDEVARKRIDTTRQKASELFYLAYKDESNLAKYYLVKLVFDEETMPKKITNEEINELKQLRPNMEWITSLLVDLAIKNTKLEIAKNKAEEAKGLLQDTMRDQAHTVKNTIQPRGIDSVIRSIRTDPNRREDVLTLHRACQAERKVLQLNALMEIKMQGVELLRHAIQKSVSHEANGDCINVQCIIDYVFSRMLDDALNPYRYNLSRFRDDILNRTGQTIRALRASYDDAVVANYARRDKSMMPVWSWFSETVCQLDFQIQPVWKNLYIKSGSVLEILLFKWLNELILNALKYHVADGSPLVSIALTEEEIRGESFLKINVINPVDGFSDDSGTLMGLELMKLEIDKINDRIDSFRVDRSPSYFTVTILLKKSLFTAGD